MQAVVLSVAHVVHEVGGARGRAVGDERRRGLDPAQRVPDLRREDEPGEEQQVLRPLARPHRDERRPAHPSTVGRKRDDLGPKRKRHGAGSYGGRSAR